MKITVEVEIFDDPEHCESKDKRCDYGAHGYFCSLFFDDLSDTFRDVVRGKTDEEIEALDDDRDENGTFYPIKKCEKCKAAWKEGKQEE